MKDHLTTSSDLLIHNLKPNTNNLNTFKLGWGHSTKFKHALGTFLCFGNEASKDRFVVGLSVGLLITNFKEVSKMIYVPVNCLLIHLGA